MWAIMPVLGAQELTEAAIGDLLAQSIPVKILIVNQGVETAFRTRLEQIAEEYPDRILLWNHVPPLPSLSATWNRALEFVWETGGTEALVTNNDVRLDQRTYSILQTVLTWPKRGNLFVTAVGVTQEQFDTRPDPLFDTPESNTIPEHEAVYDGLAKGGPDFSCFMTSREGHEKYPFDKNLIPAFCEDLDLHRRYMLGGDGTRIFSINLPFHHVKGGSQTIRTMTPERRAALEDRINRGSRAWYRLKWGGDVNAERFTIPFDPESAQDGVTTPDLQRACLATD